MALNETLISIYVTVQFFLVRKYLRICSIKEKVLFQAKYPINVICLTIQKFEKLHQHSIRYKILKFNTIKLCLANATYFSRFSTQICMLNFILMNIELFHYPLI